MVTLQNVLQRLCYRLMRMRCQAFLGNSSQASKFFSGVLRRGCTAHRRDAGLRRGLPEDAGCSGAQRLVESMDKQEVDVVVYPTWNAPPHLIGDFSKPDGAAPPQCFVGKYQYWCHKAC